MRGINFSIRAILATVAFVGVGCLALLHAGPMWAGALYTVVVAFLFYAVLAAIFRRGSARAFWIGVAVLGAGYGWLADAISDPSEAYQLVTSSPEPSRNGERYLRNPVFGMSTSLLTNQALLAVYDDVLPTVTSNPAVPVSAPQSYAEPWDPNAPTPSIPSYALTPARPEEAPDGPRVLTEEVVYPSGERRMIYKTVPTSASLSIRHPAINDFMQVGHALWTVVIAVLGGVVARKLYRASEKIQPTAAASS